MRTEGHWVKEHCSPDFDDTCQDTRKPGCPQGRHQEGWHKKEGEIAMLLYAGLELTTMPALSSSSRPPALTALFRLGRSFGQQTFRRLAALSGGFERYCGIFLETEKHEPDLKTACHSPDLLPLTGTQGSMAPPSECLRALASGFRLRMRTSVRRRGTSAANVGGGNARMDKMF